MSCSFIQKDWHQWTCGYICLTLPVSCFFLKHWSLQMFIWNWWKLLFCITYALSKFYFTRRRTFVSSFFKVESGSSLLIFLCWSSPLRTALSGLAFFFWEVSCPPPSTRLSSLFRGQPQKHTPLDRSGAASHCTWCLYQRFITCYLVVMVKVFYSWFDFSLLIAFYLF